MGAEIPAELAPLLHSTAVAFVSTYRGEHVDVEQPGVGRIAATLDVQRVTSQSGH